MKKMCGLLGMCCLVFSLHGVECVIEDAPRDLHTRFRRDFGSMFPALVRLESGAQNNPVGIGDLANVAREHAGDWEETAKRLFDWSAGVAARICLPSAGTPVEEIHKAYNLARERLRRCREVLAEENPSRMELWEASGALASLNRARRELVDSGVALFGYVANVWCWRGDDFPWWYHSYTSVMGAAMTMYLYDGVIACAGNVGRSAELWWSAGPRSVKRKELYYQYALGRIKRLAKERNIKIIPTTCREW